MKIQNIRLGFATNSSSSHSIVIVNPKHPLPAETSDAPEYGWDWFVLKSKEAKQDYLAETLFLNIREQVGEDIATAVVRDWIGDEYDQKYLEEGFVDHQSLITLPLNYDGKGVNRAFYQDLAQYLWREDIAIIGGNDNSDGPDWADNQRRMLKDLPTDESLSVAVKSGKEWWTLFNRETGAKLRISFEDKPAPLQRSSFPELIDLKITNKCLFGCRFCYQDSTPEGKEAQQRDLDHLLYSLSAAEVLEVAIGGGEPTQYPYFVRLLKNLRNYQIVPNFTTFTLDWSEDVLRAVKAHAGNFAFSVKNARDVHQLAAFNEMHDLNGTAQCVLEAYPTDNYLEVLGACSLTYTHLTLLGFKRVGRGVNYKTYEIKDWIKPLKALWRVSVDTLLVDQYGKQLEEAGISRLLMTPTEGRFSMYIDAVEKQYGISSYHTETFRPYTDRDSVLDMWRKLLPDVVQPA